jgi:hypothetical protein
MILGEKVFLVIFEDDLMDSALNYYGAVAFERLLDDYSTTTVAAILDNEKAQQLGSPAPRCRASAAFLWRQICFGGKAD